MNGDSGIKIMITINELFSGIGAQVAAFKRLGIPHKVVGISEIDKYAIQSYEAINGPTRNYGDITQIPMLDYADLWIYSSPCQDFSTAGKQKGIYNDDGSLTRSGLLLHVERLLTDAVIRGDNPRYLLMENVKGLVSKKFKPDFERWLQKLEQLGYKNYWQVLNAKDYGIPQNRERVFVVSIRKDIDKSYKFPSPIPLQLKLQDILEPSVDEKYFLKAEITDKLLKKLNERNISYAIDANYYRGGNVNSYLNKSRRTLVKQVGNIVDSGNFKNPQRGRIDSPSGCSPTLNTCQGGGLEPKILTGAIRGRNPDNPTSRQSGLPSEQMLEINTTGCSNTLTSVQKDNILILDEQNNYIKNNGIIGTLTTDGSSPKKNNRIIIGSTQKNAYIGSCETYSPCLTSAMGMGGGQIPMISNNISIRKLTPRECWRLMGFTDIEFDCAKFSGVSNSQLYRQAGNSIVVDVLVGIFKELFND